MYKQCMWYILCVCYVYICYILYFLFWRTLPDILYAFKPPSPSQNWLLQSGPLVFFLHPKSSLLLIHLLLTTFTVLWFELEVGFHIHAVTFCGGLVCFLPRSTWILLNCLVSFHRIVECFYEGTHIYNSPLWGSSLSDWSLFLHKLKEPRSWYLAVWLSANNLS